MILKEFHNICIFIIDQMDLDDYFEILLNKYHSFHINPHFASPIVGVIPYIRQYDKTRDRWILKASWSIGEIHNYIGEDNKKFDRELLRIKLEVS
jgi:hypothetical protein